VFKGFKEFILRGNVVQLAVAVVMGAAFGAITTAMVQDIITPLITAIFGKPDYANLYFTLHKSKIMYGSFLNAVLTFVFVAIGVYFLIVAPMNHVENFRRRRQGVSDDPVQTAPTELELLAQIRDALIAQRPASDQPSTADASVSAPASASAATAAAVADSQSGQPGQAPQPGQPGQPGGRHSAPGQRGSSS
jgi:large conductance mechanosensitive channel